MSKLISLAVFILITLGVGLMIGFVTMPAEWYAALNKPWFTPPNWLFGPAWSILYVMIAVAGWRCWLRDRRGLAMKLWLIQMLLNFSWSPLFFGAQQPALALVIIVAMVATTFAFIAATWKRDQITALLFVPYAAWTSFATLLNATIVMMN
ncbi:TspO/MBR family protein [Pseudochelatococcus sp. G4_1912]|uniref:TspO/MBR family protein n=1 Tax=Pseudochelatococcus sp. G4_1912 TaxID=3114288 RepID=UPI0039C64D34